MPQEACPSQQNEPERAQFPPIGLGSMGANDADELSDQLNGNFQPETALVLFSGGQDSTTCLAWALERFARVETLGFDYGQRHAIELDCRAACCRHQIAAAGLGGKAGREPHVDIPTLAEISDTALTRDVEIAMGADGLPNTFVPGRNLVFMTFAAALAYRRGISTSSAACARPIIPAIRIAATRPSRRCRSRSISAWPGSSNCTRR